MARHNSHREETVQAVPTGRGRVTVLEPVTVLEQETSLELVTVREQETVLEAVTVRELETDLAPAIARIAVPLGISSGLAVPRASARPEVRR